MRCCGWRPKERSPYLPPGPLIRLVTEVVNELLGWQPKERLPALAPDPFVSHLAFLLALLYSFRRCHRGADAARAQPSRAPVALPFSRSFHPTAPMMGWNPAIGPAQRGAPSLSRRTTSLDDGLDELDADDWWHFECGGKIACRHIGLVSKRRQEARQAPG